MKKLLKFVVGLPLGVLWCIICVPIALVIFISRESNELAKIISGFFDESLKK